MDCSCDEHQLLYVSHESPATPETQVARQVTQLEFKNLKNQKKKKKDPKHLRLSEGTMSSGLFVTVLCFVSGPDIIIRRIAYSQYCLSLNNKLEGYHGFRREVIWLISKLGCKPPLPVPQSGTGYCLSEL